MASKPLSNEACDGTNALDNELLETLVYETCTSKEEVDLILQSLEQADPRCSDLYNLRKLTHARGVSAAQLHIAREEVRQFRERYFAAPKSPQAAPEKAIASTLSPKLGPSGSCNEIDNLSLVVPGTTTLQDPLSSALHNERYLKKLPSGRFDYGLSQGDLDRIECWKPDSCRLPKEQKPIRRANISVSQWHEYRRQQWMENTRVAQMPQRIPQNMHDMERLASIWQRWIDDESDVEARAKIKNVVTKTCNDLASAFKEWNQTISKALEMKQAKSLPLKFKKGMDKVAQAASETKSKAEAPIPRRITPPFIELINKDKAIPTAIRNLKSIPQALSGNKKRLCLAKDSTPMAQIDKLQAALEKDTLELEDIENHITDRTTTEAAKASLRRSRNSVKQRIKETTTKLEELTVGQPEGASSVTGPFVEINSTSTAEQEHTANVLPPTLAQGKDTTGDILSTVLGATADQSTTPSVDKVPELPHQKALAKRMQSHPETPRRTPRQEMKSKESRATPIHIAQTFLPALNSVLQQHHVKKATNKDIGTWNDVDNHYRHFDFWKSQKAELEGKYCEGIKKSAMETIFDQGNKHRVTEDDDEDIIEIIDFDTQIDSAVPEDSPPSKRQRINPRPTSPPSIEPNLLSAVSEVAFLSTPQKDTRSPQPSTCIPGQEVSHTTPPTPKPTAPSESTPTIAPECSSPIANTKPPIENPSPLPRPHLNNDTNVGKQEKKTLAPRQHPKKRQKPVQQNTTRTDKNGRKRKRSSREGRVGDGDGDGDDADYVPSE